MSQGGALAKSYMYIIIIYTKSLSFNEKENMYLIVFTWKFCSCMRMPLGMKLHLLGKKQKVKYEKVIKGIQVMWSIMVSYQFKCWIKQIYSLIRVSGKPE